MVIREGDDWMEERERDLAVGFFFRESIYGGVVLCACVFVCGLWGALFFWCVFLLVFFAGFLVTSLAQTTFLSTLCLLS
jgi:hypothetical protein